MVGSCELRGLGEVNSEKFIQSVQAAHIEAVHWKGNIFAVPSGNAGKVFVSEIARMFRAYAKRSALEAIAVSATTILPILLLQKPHHNSKTREHIAQQLTSWEVGDTESLLQECRTIQHFKSCSTREDQDQTAHVFAKLMFQGKTTVTVRLISEEGKGHPASG